MAKTIKERMTIITGALYMVRSVKVLFSEWRIFRLAIAPILINLLIFAGFFATFNYLVYDWIMTAVFETGDMAWYWDILYWFAGVILFMISLVVVYFGFVALGLIIASPFNDFLSAAVERKMTGAVVEARQNIKELIFFILKNESKKIAIILAIQIALALIAFIPGVGQIIFAVVTPLFLAAVMAFEFTGYTLDRRGLSFKEKRSYLRSRMGLSFGFGLSVAATLLIPIVNFILLPLAVTGGTMLVVENRPTGSSSSEEAGS